MTTRESKILYARKWRLEHKNQVKEYNAQYQKDHAIEIAQYYKENKNYESKRHKEKYLKNRDKILARNRAYVKNNKEEANRRNREWRKKNKGIVALWNLKYKYHRKLRMVGWISKEEQKAIKDFYIACPDGMEVDHIIPLLGEQISGLHVLKNLQYLNSEENDAKGNRFPYYPLEFYKNKGLIP